MKIRSIASFLVSDSFTLDESSIKKWWKYQGGSFLNHFKLISRPKIGLQWENQINCIIFSFGLFLIKRNRSRMDENGWIGTALDVNLCTWPKQKLWCMKLACNLRNLELLNFCFRTEPFSSALLSFDSNISTTIGRRISWLGSFEASFQDENFKLSWVSVASKMC